MRAGLTGKPFSQKFWAKDKIKKRLKDNFSHGQSVLEVLIALAILTAVIASGVSIVFLNQSSTNQTSLAQQATYLAKENLETARVNALSNFSSVTNSSTTQAQFLIETYVKNIDFYTKQVTSKVSWRGVYTQTSTVQLNTLLTDWKTASANSGAGSSNGGGSSSGGGGISGNWTNPQVYGSINLGPGNQATGIAVKTNVAYLVATASDPKKPDFFAFNVSNPSSPTQLSSLNTGPGLNAVKLQGNYAFLANTDSNSQLQIVDISSPSNPNLIASVGLVNNNSQANSVFASGNYVYVGTATSTGNEFQIFNVTSPSNPTYVSSVKISGTVNDIYVINGLAYLATSRADAQVMIYNVQSPQSPSLVSTFNLAGAGDGLSVFPYSPTILLAGLGNYFVTLDTTNIASLNLLGSFNAGGAINGIVAKDYLAFLATANSNQELQIINITNLKTPYLYSYTNFPQVATGIDYLNNYIYVSVRSNDGLKIITSQ